MKWTELSLAVSLVSTALPAHAHFRLLRPDSVREQDASGNPQKLAPCGDETATQKPTGKLTTVHAGDTVTIELEETVYHPGHYRVAIAKARSELPAEPPVTAGATPCGSVPIQAPAVFPVLADGLLVHSAPFRDKQTITVSLPTDLRCETCTLQVIQFMSDHGLNNPGGCFYHHCAALRVEPAASDAGAAVDASLAPVDGSTAAPVDASIDSAAPAAFIDARVAAVDPDDASPTPEVRPVTREEGCAIATEPGASPWLAAALLWLARRRRVPVRHR